MQYRSPSCTRAHTHARGPRERTAHTPVTRIARPTFAFTRAPATPLPARKQQANLAVTTGIAVCRRLVPAHDGSGLLIAAAFLALLIHGRLCAAGIIFIRTLSLLDRIRRLFVLPAGVGILALHCGSTREKKLHVTTVTQVVIQVPNFLDRERGLFPAAAGSVG